MYASKELRCLISDFNDESAKLVSELINRSLSAILTLYEVRLSLLINDL